MRLSFASGRPVYPMRLSRLAKTPQSLGLYVLAPHRMEPRSAIGGAEPEIFFAGRITPVGSLRKLGGNGRTFLTALDQNFPQPRRITGDHELRRTAADTPFQRVTYSDVLLKAGGVPAWVLTVGATLLLLVAAAALTPVLRRRRRVPPRRPVPPHLT
ncbi:DUF2330 domain-containing protein [Streptomyces sp. NPDC048637]|uniref:DUF2330 domain-containing protein n=1 Tax=Streptomyces sp. NPDC048637 TaxID=3155636 RepID=UPI003415EC0F